MANVKFSQFNLITSLSATGFLAGYDGANNTRISLASLETSLNLANLSGDINLATQVTGTLPILNGGTGATTQQAALNAIANVAGAISDNQILRESGGNVGWQFPSSNPYIAKTVVFRAQWSGVTVPFFNLTNGVNNLIPFDASTTFVTTVSDGATGFLSPSMSVLAAGSQITIPAGLYGAWRITTVAYLFDQFNNIDVLAGVWNYNTGAVLERTIDEKAAELSSNRAFYGETVVSINAANNVIGMYINPSINTPFPSNQDGLMTEMILEYLG